MKLQIKTLNQKSIVIDIEETKTVYELKKELSLYPDIGVKPDLQKLIYAGKVLANEDKLSTYSIDVKKFLVIMILKQPLEETPTTTQPQQENLKEESTKAKEKEKEKDIPATPSEATATVSKKENLVSQIVSMGYPESDVRRALAASFYNPERAIEYLIEGIPNTPSTSEFESHDDLSAPFAMLRGDPRFQRLRNVLQQRPELLDVVIKRIGETSPSLLHLITEHQNEFLNLLEESSDDEDFDDDEDDDDEEDDMGDCADV